VYSFSSDEHQFGMRLWRLEPAEYEMAVTVDRESADAGSAILRRSRLQLPERGAKVGLCLPARTLCGVELKQVSAFPTKVGPFPDLAVSSADLCIQPNGAREGETARFSLTVHNIGIAPARGVKALFLDGESVFASAAIEHLEAPLDLVPRASTVAVEWRATKGRHQITAVVDPEDAIREIAELNNRCCVEVTVP
jgi:hypothetical protein